MRYLLDTNICIAAMRNHEGVVAQMSRQAPDECAISAITGYELHTGIKKCNDPAREEAKVAVLLTTVRELPFDSYAAREAANVRALLESRGQSIGPYDVLLAGHALAAGLILVTDNTAEFARVPGIVLENWKVPMSQPSP
jgi:tRNA(fMet)-specific endonuclease VapC